MTERKRERYRLIVKERQAKKEMKRGEKSREKERERTCTSGVCDPI